MHALFLALVLAGASLPSPPLSGDSAPVFKRSIPLAGVKGRIDHLALDPQSERLFVAALENGSLEVIDLKKGERVKRVTGLKEPQGVAFVPATRQIVVACGGDGTVVAYDATTLEEKHRSVVGEDADNVRQNSDARFLAVGHGSGAIALLDAASLKPIGDIKFNGHPESFQLESGSSRIFINVPGGFVGGGGAIVVADLKTQQTVAKWPLKEAGRNFPMALDTAHKRLYVGCRRSAKLLVIDTELGTVLASPDCVGDADEVFVDEKTGHVLVVGGDGAVDVFETKDQIGYSKSASIKTASGARTGLLSAETHSLYVAVPKRPGQDAEIREYSLPD